MTTRKRVLLGVSAIPIILAVIAGVKCFIDSLGK